jgi:hypothetical protein
MEPETAIGDVRRAQVLAGGQQVLDSAGSDTLLGLKSSSFSDYSELQESVPGQCPGIYA